MKNGLLLQKFSAIMQYGRIYFNHIIAQKYVKSVSKTKKVWIFIKAKKEGEL